MYIVIDQESFVSILFFYKFTSTLKEYAKYPKIIRQSKTALENEIILSWACWKMLQCYIERTHSHHFVYVQVWDFLFLNSMDFASGFIQLKCKKTSLRKSRNLNMVWVLNDIMKILNN